MQILLTVLAAKEKPPINVVGDVGGRIAIMVVSKTWTLLHYKEELTFLKML